MKTFQFTLQAVRTVRDRQQREAVEHYGLALLEHLRARERWVVLDEELARVRFEWQQLASAGCLAEELARLQVDCAVRAARLDESAATVATAERAMNCALNTLLSAKQACDAVEDLLNDQRAAYDRVLNRAEQKDLDDLVRRPLARTAVCQTQTN